MEMSNRVRRGTALRRAVGLGAILLAAAVSIPTEAQEEVVVFNGGFETVDADRGFAAGWKAAIGGGADAEVEVDTQERHSGERSMRITNRSPFQAFVFASFASDPIPVEPSTTYNLRFWVKGRQAQNCYASAGYGAEGETRKALPAGDFDWRPVLFSFTTPERAASLTLRFASDDVTEAIWIDDVRLEVSPQQWANLAERRYPKDFPGVFPRSRGPLPERLVVYDDTRGNDRDVSRLVSCLQGLVNRSRPRLYVIHRTNPAYYDEVWLRYLQEKGYTGTEERLSDLESLVARFRDEIAGVIVVDPDLPGSYAAAAMLGGIENALPATPELADRLGLPVVQDLRGRWKRNVDAYRHVYDECWDRMNHHVLAWTHPTNASTDSWDYMTQFNIFRFWVSNPADNEQGADPDAEERFVNELLANTPANVPVMGWPASGDRGGVPEYTGVRWLSEFGKFVPGTEFASNLSIHSAVEPPAEAFRRETPAPAVELDPNKTYISVNIMDSGDAVWYFQLWQRKIWSDPVRGTVPIGWCMNVTLGDLLPAVAQWYFENATPNDTFFGAVSGLGYMNTQVYASRFRPEDRARILSEYAALTGEYCRKLGLRGVELYNGSWGEKTPPTPDTFPRFVDAIEGLDYILADLGRHENITPDNANYCIGDTVVFHTLTRFQVWSSSAETLRDTMAKDNAWLVEEIRTNTPRTKPGFMSAMAISWYYYPTWFKDLESRLGPDYVLVSPPELARLYREHLSGGDEAQRREDPAP